jgi:hypothetical protein
VLSEPAKGETMRLHYRKRVTVLFFLFLGFLLLKLNYAPDFQQNFPVYRSGRFRLPAFFSLWGISGVSFSFYLLLILSASIFVSSAIPGFRGEIRRIFFRDKKATAGLLFLILSLIPDSGLCYEVVGFILSSLVLFLLFVYFLYPVSSKIIPFLFRIKKAVFSLSTRKLLGGIFLLVFFTTNMISAKVFHHYPHIYDSVAQLFQAKIFLRGQLTAQAPGPREFFLYNNIILDVAGRGRWYSQYLPGHAFLLFLGLLLKAPWLVNPLFGSLSVILLYFLGRQLYGEATGRLCLILGAASPFILFMSSEFMNHTTCGFFLILGFFWGSLADCKPVAGDSAEQSGSVCNSRNRKKSLFFALGTGTALGMAHLIRPFSSFVVSFPLMVYLMFRWVQRKKWKEAGLFLLSLCLFAGILLIYNTLTNGHPLLFGHKVLYKSEIGVGFGYSIRGYPSHTPRLGLRNLLNNLNELNLYLFQWPIPSLTFVAILLGSGRLKKEDKLLLVCFASLLLAFLFYWAQQLLLGPRYMYEAGFILILLTARGIIFLKDLLGRQAEGHVLGVLAICLVIGFFHVRSLALTYSNNYCYFNPTLLENIREKGVKNALIFNTFYHMVFAGVEPDPNADIIFARDRGEEKNRELIQRYPGRKLYRSLIYDIYPYYPFEKYRPSKQRNPESRESSGVDP